MSCSFCSGLARRNLANSGFYSAGCRSHVLFLNDSDELVCCALEDFHSGRHFKINFRPNCGEDLSLFRLNEQRRFIKRVCNKCDKDYVCTEPEKFAYEILQPQIDSGDFDHSKPCYVSVKRAADLLVVLADEIRVGRAHRIKNRSGQMI